MMSNSGASSFTVKPRFELGILKTKYMSIKTPVSQDLSLDRALARDIASPEGISQCSEAAIVLRTCEANGRSPNLGDFACVCACVCCVAKHRLFGHSIKGIEIHHTL